MHAYLGQGQIVKNALLWFTYLLRDALFMVYGQLQYQLRQ